MRVLVTGSRDYRDEQTLFAELDGLAPTVIIQGECPYGGADRLAAKYAESRRIPCIGVKAHFRTIGRSAGPIRNGWMLKHCGPVDLVAAFPGGDGTDSMIALAKRAGVPVRLVGRGTQDERENRRHED